MERLWYELVRLKRFLFRKTVTFADASDVINSKYRPLIQKAFDGTLTIEEINNTSRDCDRAVRELFYGPTKE